MIYLSLYASSYFFPATFYLFLIYVVGGNEIVLTFEGATDDFSSRVCDALCAVISMDLSGLSPSTSVSGEALVPRSTSSINTSSSTSTSTSSSSSNNKINLTSIVSSFSSAFLSVASESVSSTGGGVSERGLDLFLSRPGEEKVTVVNNDNPSVVVPSKGFGEKKTSGRSINPKVIAAKLAALREDRREGAGGGGGDLL